VSSQKRKLSNGNTKENQKKTPEVFTPSKKVKTEQPATPKTPLQQKENKSPKVSDSCSPPSKRAQCRYLGECEEFRDF